MRITKNQNRRVLGLAFGVLSVGIFAWQNLQDMTFPPTIVGVPANLLGGVAFLVCLLLLLDWDRQ